MDVAAVMSELEAYGKPQTKRILMKHGATEPFFGVQVGDMKKILKKTKKDHALAGELYATGNGDAMYLAALMADEKQVTARQLDDWVGEADWYMVSEYGVAALAAESPHGWDRGKAWIDDDRDHVSAAGWAALGHWVSIRADEALDLAALAGLLDRVRDTSSEAPNRTRYTMNGFVIAVGCYVTELSEKARTIAEQIGKVSVDMGGSACKVPLATAAIDKVVGMGRLGKKRKHARC
jgi:hypothetical protein